MPNKKEYTEMTSDAKVGLLLGLLLIAIIILAINGVPDFIPSAKNTPVVETAVTTQTSGNLVIEPAVVDVARNLQEKRTSVRYVTPPAEVVPPDESVGGSGQAPTAQTVSNDTASSASPAAEVKEAAQPDTKTAVVGSKTQQPAVQKTEQVQKTNQQEVAAAPKTVVVASHVVEEGESLAYIAKKYYGTDEGNKKTTIQMLYEANKNVLESPDKIRVGDQLVIPKVASAATEQTAPAKKGKESAVGTSTLLDKFKNVFMSTSGKKDNPAVKDVAKEKPTAKDTTKEKPMVKDVTKEKPTAKDATKEKLTVKDVTKEKPAVKEVAREKPVVKNGSKDKNETSAVTDKKAEKTQPSKGVTEYTVQSGDHLYKIAQKFLGDGNRYPELQKLNSDVLSGSDRLEVGMKLKVPKP
jgi:nucleoid-associated protein YgaU